MLSVDRSGGGGILRSNFTVFLALQLTQSSYEAWFSEYTSYTCFQQVPRTLTNTTDYVFS